MKIGDPCVIWNGESPIGDPLSWLFGVVVKKRTDRKIGKEMYQCGVMEIEMQPGMISMISSWKMWKEGGER